MLCATCARARSRDAPLSCRSRRLSQIGYPAAYPAAYPDRLSRQAIRGYLRARRAETFVISFGSICDVRAVMLCAPCTRALTPRAALVPQPTPIPDRLSEAIQQPIQIGYPRLSGGRRPEIFDMSLARFPTCARRHALRAMLTRARAPLTRHAPTPISDRLSEPI
jgi:hypothetical protein